MFIRSSELVANPGRSSVLGPKVAEMRDVLTRTTGTEWHAWVAFAGRPYGTYVLSTRHADYAEMVTGLMQIGAAPEWAELTASVDGVLAHPASSLLVEVIAVTGEPSSPKQFVTATSATLSGRNMAKAVAWSCDVAEHVSKITGQSGMVATSAAGSMFQVGWLSSVDTPAELDAAGAAISGDAGYLEMLEQAGNERWFVDGSIDRIQLVRMP
jgi:hypothetical protein